GAERGPGRAGGAVLRRDGVEVASEIGEPVPGLRRDRVAVTTEAEPHLRSRKDGRDPSELPACVREAVAEDGDGFALAVDLDVQACVADIHEGHGVRAYRIRLSYGRHRRDALGRDGRGDPLRGHRLRGCPDLASLG